MADDAFNGKTNGSLTTVTAERGWLCAAAINMAIAVALGAFGAHGLKKVASTQQMQWWQTATLYLLIHALGLLLVAVLINLRLTSKTPAWLLQVGIAIFASTLYAMALGAPRWLGAITPIGGTLMIAGWLYLAWSLYQANSKNIF